jgi:hypothetical protein
MFVVKCQVAVQYPYGCNIATGWNYAEMSKTGSWKVVHSHWTIEITKKYIFCALMYYHSADILFSPQKSILNTVLPYDSRGLTVSVLYDRLVRHYLHVLKTTEILSSRFCLCLTHDCMILWVNGASLHISIPSVCVKKSAFFV